MRFEKHLRRIQKSSQSNINQTLSLAQKSAEEAVYIPNGYFCSSVIESIYLKAASLIPAIECDPVPNTVLHIMTRAYLTGGHTRVVERWIKFSKENECHSVLFIDHPQNESVPQWLMETVARKSGSVFFLDEKDIIEKGAKLRQIAAKFQRIILHTHMEDGTPIIAFGTESFKTPVILFNHADHVFWLGTSIADLVADIRKDNTTIEKRHSYGYYLGIPPTDELISQISENERLATRKELGIPDKAFVCVTTAPESKLEPIGCLDIKRLIKKLIKNNVFYILIGPSYSNIVWRDIAEESNGHIKLLGSISNKYEYRKCLSCANIYIGSFPMMSFTASQDAVQCGLPILQYRVLQQESHKDIYPEESEVVCNSINDLEEKVLRANKESAYYKQLVTESQNWLKNTFSQSDWVERLYSLYDTCPSTHSIHKFTNSKREGVVINDALVLNSFLYNQRFDYANKLLRGIAHLWIKFKLK